MPDVIRITSFGGEIPSTGIRSLPDGYAAEARNAYLYEGELRGMQSPEDLQPIASLTHKVFRIPSRLPIGGPPFNGTVPPPSYLGSSVWYQFSDIDTDIVRGPLIEDAHERFYFCSPQSGPVYNTRARLIAGDPFYLLGVSQPASSMGIAVVGGVAPSNVTRAYVVTWETIYGEEGAPSPPATAAGKPDGSWNLTLIPQPSPADLLQRAQINRVNVYRTITSSSGVATFFRVVQLALGVTAYNDVLPDTTVASNLSLSSVNFVKPPPNLQGLIAMPNGFMVGWVGSNLYFSEPYLPHAWPAEYKQSTEFEIVGLGVFGATGVACTQGYPEMFTGVKPVSVSFTKMKMNEPCLSRGSIVSNLEGVYYASQNGLMAVTAGGMVNVTQQLITREKWSKDYAPQYLRAVRYQSSYLALKAFPGGVGNSGFSLDPSALKVAIMQYDLMPYASNLHPDVYSGEILLINSVDKRVARWDPLNDDWWPTLWRSKEYQLPRELNFGVFAIYWDAARYSANSEGLALLPKESQVRFRVWAERALVYDETVPPEQNGKANKLPSGFKSSIWQFEIRARAPVFSIHIARTAKELAVV